MIGFIILLSIPVFIIALEVGSTYLECHFPSVLMVIIGLFLSALGIGFWKGDEEIKTNCGFLLLLSFLGGTFQYFFGPSWFKEAITPMLCS